MQICTVEVRQVDKLFVIICSMSLVSWFAACIAAAAAEAVCVLEWMAEVQQLSMLEFQLFKKGPLSA